MKHTTVELLSPENPSTSLKPLEKVVPMNRIAPNSWYLVALTVLGCVGCQSMGPLGRVGLPWSKHSEVVESRYQSPARLVAIWTDASYNTVGKKPIRGFGGRLYFYNQKQQPVPVEGQLVVYAYDDTDPSGPSQGPSRKYVFTPEQLTEHFSESDLGASYSIWLPWDEVGGEQKSISLVPILTNASGQVITGAQSINLLPGTRPNAEAQEFFSRVEPESAGARQSLNKLQAIARGPMHSLANGYVSPASYQEPSTGEPRSPIPTRMETTTIKPTGRLAEQLLAQRNQAIAQRHFERAAAQESAIATPATLSETQQPPLATPLPPTVHFSKRPGETFPSRIYTGSETQ